MRRLLARNLLHPLLSLRDGDGYLFHRRQVRHEIEAEGLSAEWRADRLREIVRHAYERSPFYRRFYDEHGFHPSRLHGPDDLPAVPVLEKHHIAAHAGRILVPDYSPRDLVPAATGGTTGNSFVFWYDRRCRARRTALTHYGNELYGWRVGDPTAAFWNAMQDLPEGTGLKRRLRRSLATRTWVCDASRIDEERMSGWLDLLRRRRIEVLYGYAHSLTAFAKYVRQMNAGPLPVRLVVTTAEPLYPEGRAALAAAFQCPIHDRYASREHGLMAQEFAPGQWHIFASSIHLEVLPASAGAEAGTVLVTDYWNRAFPFIRYRIGDTCRGPIPSGPASPLGLPRLPAFTGRETDFLVAQDGAIVSGMTFHHVYERQDGGFGRSEYAQIQFVQTARDRLVINLVPGAGYVIPASEEDLRHFVARVLGETVAISFRYVQEIPLSRSGKYRFTINAIEQPSSAEGLERSDGP
jgi:phenylacetate-CoA ligase